MHRAVAKIATGSNAADNFWRQGNMLGAIELETGIISRVVRGTGAEMSLNEAHQETKRPIVGTLIPNGRRLRAWSSQQQRSCRASAPNPGMSRSPPRGR
jgi:hypothetical protein